MNDTLAGPLTAFDAIALTLIIVSALMALARGFLRELATLIAFIAAAAAAYFARHFLREPLAAMIPDTMPSWTPDAVIIIIAFLLIYITLSVIGGKLSKTVQGVDGVGVVNRLSGFVFGVARGIAVMVGFVFVINLALPQERLPRWISEARLYPYFADWAQKARVLAPDLAESAKGLAGDTSEEPAETDDTPG